MTSDSEHFWDGLRHRRVVLQECGDCGLVRFPPMPGCPACGSGSWTARDSTCEGSIYSYIRVHRPIAPLSADEVPVTFATVELDEGCRVVARLLGTGAPQVGDRVTAVFVDRGSWTELAVAAAVAGERAAAASDASRSRRG